MTKGNFVWADLSTFNLNDAYSFYSAVFDWKSTGLDPTGYNICLANNQEAAGLYVMPDFFQQINMPSFWMSYIQVDDIKQTVEVAAQMGGKVEVGPEPFGEQAEGQIALIRDPLGAGFTVYEGEFLKGRDPVGSHGRMVWNELIISDIQKIQPFYQALFGWRVEQVDGGQRYNVYSETNKLIANIEEISNDIKGDLEFWGVYFAVADLDQAMRIVKRHGGAITFDNQTADSRQVMCTDPQGAAFLLTQGQSNQHIPWLSGFKWRSWVGLLLIFAAVAFEWTIFWFFLFCLWLLPDIKSGVTYFLEPVARRENPILYWTILGTWTVLAIYPVIELLQVY
ncbi:MAG: VOC family protein [Chloroflexota bacterium]